MFTCRNLLRFWVSTLCGKAALLHGHVCQRSPKDLKVYIIKKSGTSRSNFLNLDTLFVFFFLDLVRIFPNKTFYIPRRKVAILYTPRFAFKLAYCIIHKISRVSRNFTRHIRSFAECGKTVSLFVIWTYTFRNELPCDVSEKHFVASNQVRLFN